MSYKETLEKLVKIIVEERNECIENIAYLNKQQYLNENELTALVENIAIRNKLNAILSKAGVEV